MIPGSGSLLPAHRSPLRDLAAADRTVPRLLQRQAQRYGDKPLVVRGATTWSYRDTVDRAARMAGALKGRGIEPGDRIALLCGNRLELLEILLGCAWLGAIAVPLNNALRGAGLRHALTDSGARVVVVEPDLLGVLDEVGVPVERWVVGETFPAPGPVLPARPVTPGETLAILYTSGTTGLPKGVCCPQAQFFWWGVSVGECLEITDDDVLYTCLPLFHTNALNAFFQAVCAGATYVLGGRFSASRFWDEVRAAGATVTYLLGAMVQILLSRPPGGADAAHRVRIALSPATPAAAHAAFRERFGVLLVDGYGSTETNMVLGAHPAAQRPGYMGVVLPDHEVRVVDAEGLDVPDGEPGELVCRSRHPYAYATGYFENPAATAAAYRDRWFHTGDRVVREPGGWLRFLDRLTDSIRRRGENISSLEVEQVVATHPAVSAVAVYAVPSELSEDEVMAAVVPTPGEEVDPAELTEWCEPRLARFAIPRFVDVVAELPLTENGKVRKAVLRERGITAATWDRTKAGA
ncbi:ATP-dependent acyl-CoA ligase [Pseudonocardia cypriaca]|uniref:Crotonobetaine/carnitine-CoA ligase n=1 Tax=Pseudonocardia cypriaca TaxID=882449 RepID=A0A543GE08_9PSEU|nr:ATP-dependent acyl-CoA ligase [Pseudonocardia cypriaca]TQM44309.1 crotonobetaine/carnitine-CoA ligase [Pseudonocardia cypriaca]